MSDAPDSTRKQCRGVTKSGQPCRSTLVLEGGYCIAHSPRAEVIQLRDQSRVAGGRARSNTARALKNLDPTRQGVAEMLQQAMSEVYAGTLAPAQGNSLASLARSLLAAISSGEEADRMDELARVLERLEQAIDRRHQELRVVR